MNENDKDHIAMNDYLMYFYFAYRSFTSEPDTILQKRGIQRGHHRILFFVSHYPGLRVGKLLELLQITKQAVNTPLRQLNEMGYVETKVSEEDRRVRLLYPTEKGKQLEETLSNVQKNKMEAVFEKFPPAYKKAWFQMMKEIADTEEVLPDDDLILSPRRY